MSNYNILTMLPMKSRPLDLVAGVQSWLNSGGRFESNLAGILGDFDPESHVESTVKSYSRFETASVVELCGLAKSNNLRLRLNADWFEPPIVVDSFHLGANPTLFWYYDPTLWEIKDISERADNAMLSFARAASSAYILAVSDLGYEKTRHIFYSEEDRYYLKLPRPKQDRGHGVLWVDWCPANGGQIPVGCQFGTPLSNGFFRYYVPGSSFHV